MHRTALSPKAIVYRLASALMPCMPGVAAARSQRAVATIMGHGIYTQDMAHSARPPTSSVSIEALEANIRALQRGFDFVTLTEATDALASPSRLKRPLLALTFDDSLLCMKEVVLPCLLRLGVPATFFLSTEAIENRRSYWWLRIEYASTQALPNTQIHIDGKATIVGPDPSAIRSLKASLRRKPRKEQARLTRLIEEAVGLTEEEAYRSNSHGQILSWKDAADLVSCGMEIGSHTVTHPDLATLTATDLLVEMTESRQILKQRLGANIRFFCYPYGSLNTEVITAAASSEYTGAVTTISPGWNTKRTDPFRWKRFALPNEPYRLAYTIGRAHQ